MFLMCYSQPINISIWDDNRSAFFLLFNTDPPEMEDKLTQSQISSIIAPYLLEEMGFQIASQSTIPQIFRRITPQGHSSTYRDALMEGSSLLVRLSEMLKTNEAVQQWHMLHVILVDHQDTSSVTEFTQLVKTMSMLRQVLHVKMFKMIIVGLDL